MKTINQINHLEAQCDVFKNEITRSTYIDLIRQCCCQDPNERPHFEEILDVLEVLHLQATQQQTEQAITLATEIKGEYIDT